MKKIISYCTFLFRFYMLYSTGIKKRRWIMAGNITMAIAEISAKFSNIQTSYMLFFVGVMCLTLMAIKGQKKWWWYYLFASVVICSFPTLFMHASDYTQFTPGVLSSKLVNSFYDISSCIIVAHAGIIAILFEFASKKILKKFAIAVTAFDAFALIFVAVEVFGPQHDRPLWIGGHGAPMDGVSGGLSMGEFFCLITASLVIPLFFYSIGKMDKMEKKVILFTIVCFITSFIFGTYGDHEITSYFAIHTVPVYSSFHSIWHMLSALSFFTLYVFADLRQNKTTESCT